MMYRDKIQNTRNSIESYHTKSNQQNQIVTHLLIEEKKRNCSKLPTSMHIFYSWFLLTKAKKNLVFSIKIELVYSDNTLSFTLIIENEMQQYIVKETLTQYCGRLDGIK